MIEIIYFCYNKNKKFLRWMITLFINLKQKLLSKIPLLLFLSFLFGGVIGGLGVFFWLLENDWIIPGGGTPKGYEIRGGGYRFINPLLECEVAGEEVMGKELRPFKHKVQALVDEEIESRKAVHISVYFRDLNNGPWFGINEKEEFSPASLLKVPFMMAYFKLAESDSKMLTSMVKFSGGDKSSLQDIKPSEVIEKGKSYSTEELIYRMIVYSDNDAYNLLLSNTNMTLFSQPFIDLGIEVPGVRKPEDFMSVKTYASFFRILFNASYLSKEMSEKALEFLSNVEFRDGLLAGVPSNVEVAHKFGERRIPGVQDIKQLHDCGIIYYPGNPYLLCVMTRGEDFNALTDTIKNISFFIFEEIDHQHQNK